MRIAIDFIGMTMLLLLGIIVILAMGIVIAHEIRAINRLRRPERPHVSGPFSHYSAPRLYADGSGRKRELL